MSQTIDQPAGRPAVASPAATESPVRPAETLASESVRKSANVPAGLVKATLLQIYDELFAHDGYATLRVEMRILRRNQKEVILDAGKQFRFVVDYAQSDLPGGER